jgi:hypothetical protein
MQDEGRLENIFAFKTADICNIEELALLSNMPPIMVL